MILDLSKYNGTIDWAKMTSENNIERVILRATTKNGELDTKFVENAQYAKACGIPIDIYKFSYATDTESAFNECLTLAHEVAKTGVAYDNLWIDIEDVAGKRWTTKRAFDVIAGYHSCWWTCCASDFKRMWGCIGIYCNLDYYLHVIPKVYRDNEPIWLARWTKGLLGVNAPNIKYWQYTSKGKVSGISGDVDISRKVN